MPLQAQGEFALVKKELEAALMLSGQPVKRGTMAHEHIVYMMLTESAARLGDNERLAEYARQLEILAERDDHKPYLGVAHRALGVYSRLNGQFEEASERFDLALGLFEAQGLPWQIGLTLLEMAELAKARGEIEAAHALLDRAMAQFHFLGAKREADRVGGLQAALATSAER